jgi:hypothetical protein
VGELAFTKQSAKGSASSTAGHRMLIAGGDTPHPILTEAWFEETTGARMGQDRYISETHVEGAPPLHVMPSAMVELFRGCLGSINSAGVGAPYTHTITVAATLPYYTFWRKTPTPEYEKFVDCKIKSIQLHGASGEPLVMTVNLLGLTSLRKTSAVYASEAGGTGLESTYRFLHYDGAGALLVEGAAVTSIDSFDITIENNSTAELGDSIGPNDVTEGGLDITVVANQLITSPNLRDRLFYGGTSPADNAVITNTLLELAGSPTGLQFTWTRVAAAPGPEISLQIAIPRVSVDPFDIEPTTAPSPALRAQITYHALQPAGNATPVTIVAKNGFAAGIYP